MDIDLKNNTVVTDTIFKTFWPLQLLKNFTFLQLHQRITQTIIKTDLEIIFYVPHWQSM